MNENLIKQIVKAALDESSCKMTLELAKRGYNMIGIDASADMLNVALDRKYDMELAYDVLTRWYTEKETGEIDSGRVLPKEYCFFHGDGKRNHFRDSFEFKNANFWDWSCDSPYEE